MNPDDFERAFKMAKELKRSGDNVVLEARAYTRTGEERLWTVTLCYISGEDSWDGIPSIYSVGLDVTEDRKKIEALRHQAEKDALTGIYNHAETERQIEKYLMDSPDDMGALFMIDTDNFKQINDTQGHMIGDVVLTEIASGMKKLMRESDVVGRIGGDEFMVFMKNITRPEDAEKKAGELLHLFRHLFESEKSSIKVSCSTGIAIYPRDGDAFKEIYKSADKALYRAKSKGKNNYVIYDGETAEDLEGSGLSSIGTAIDSERHYAEGSDNLARYVFRNLYQTRDFDRTVNMILEIVGKQFDVSRAYIFENTDDGQYGSNTYEWCNEGITSQIGRLKNVNYKECGDYQTLFDENMIFYCRDIHKLKPEHETLFSSQDICSTLQCAFEWDSVFAGFVGFDECTGLRLWTQEEVSTLLLVSQILSMFLIQNKRNKAGKQETESGLLS
ncbi:MAG: GGDEF domain-containing protein [Clostridia bacterium]|nr:GGDEF domain-containing protein [Clostridia bacterium]